MTVLLTVVLGLVIGSFINALVWRIATGQGFGGRSRCVHCKKTLKGIDLIPVVSFFILRGKCRFCKKAISWQYPIVEIATALAFVLIAAQPIAVLQIVAECALVGLLIALFVIDFRYGILPDILTIPAIAVALAVRWMNAEGIASLMARDILLGAMIGFFFFVLQWIVSRGAWIGDGDIRFGVLMGVLLGFPGVLEGLVLAYTMGAVVAIGLIANKRRQWGSAIALGPFLVLGTILTYYRGEWILQLFGL